MEAAIAQARSGLKSAVSALDREIDAAPALALAPLWAPVRGELERMAAGSAPPDAKASLGLWLTTGSLRRGAAAPKAPSPQT